MKKETGADKSIWKKGIPLPFFLLICCVLTAAILYLNNQVKSPVADANVQSPVLVQTASSIRNKGDLTSHILMSKMEDESPALQNVKSKITGYIEKEKQKNSFSKISVYLLKQNSGEWTGINADEGFKSSGYLRLAILITYLKEAESSVSLLDKNLAFTGTIGHRRVSTSLLEPARQYPIRELLTDMMANDDSTAKWLLADNMRREAFEKVYADLHMAIPDLRQRKFSISTGEYSKFLEVLYNATYLSKSDSEFALQLLSNNAERTGMLRQLPAEVVALHRIGKKCVADKCDLRESGIVYYDDDPYILTVFAEGSNSTELENMASEISKLAYDQISGTR